MEPVVLVDMPKMEESEKSISVLVTEGFDCWLLIISSFDCFFLECY